MLLWTNSQHFIFMVLVTIQTFLVAYKLDDGIGSSWWAVLVPSFVAVGFMLLILMVAIFSRLCSRPKSQVPVIYSAYDQNWSMWKKVVITSIMAALIFTFIIMLAVKLEEQSSLSWAVVFIPIYIMMAVLLLAFIYYMVYAAIEEITYYRNVQPHIETPTDELDEISYTWLCWVFGLTTILSLIVLTVLLALKISSSELDSWSYFAVFTPVWFYFGFMAVLVVTLLPFVCSGRTETTLFQLFAFTVVGALIVIFFILLALNADRDSSLAWHIVFIPLYILELLVIIWLLFRSVLKSSSGLTSKSQPASTESRFVISYSDDDDC